MVLPKLVHSLFQNRGRHERVFSIHNAGWAISPLLFLLIPDVTAPACTDRRVVYSKGTASCDHRSRHLRTSKKCRGEAGRQRSRKRQNRLMFSAPLMKELSIENLHVTIADQRIVRGLTLKVPRGEVHAIMG